jgi:beta-lactamase class A
MAKRHLKKRYKHIFLFLLLFFFVVGVLYIRVNYQNNDFLEEIVPSINNEKQQEEEQKQNDYNACLNKSYTEDELTDNLISLKEDIDNLIINNNYKVSVYYEDITTGFTYGYNTSTVYYGCSLIKLVDALYLIDKATKGEINLDTETVVYTSNYKVDYSSGMATRTIGEAVSLRDLITYAISVSDNTAHLMLLDYIGFNNLKEYGQSLGAKQILTGGDKYGNQTVEDTNIYLKEAYKVITENKEYGEFLKSIMDNDERNAFNTEDIKIYHKYGSYGSNFHDIGLSLEERPYAISIFTLHENSNATEVIQTIHAKIRDLHNAFYENRKTSCYQEVYGE